MIDILLLFFGALGVLAVLCIVFLAGTYYQEYKTNKRLGK